MRILLPTGAATEEMVRKAVAGFDADVVVTGEIASFLTPHTLHALIQKKKYDLVIVSGMCTASFEKVERETGCLGKTSNEPILHIIGLIRGHDLPNAPGLREPEGDCAGLPLRVPRLRGTRRPRPQISDVVSSAEASKPPTRGRWGVEVWVFSPGRVSKCSATSA